MAPGHLLSGTQCEAGTDPASSCQWTPSTNCRTAQVACSRSSGPRFAAPAFRRWKIHGLRSGTATLPFFALSNIVTRMRPSTLTHLNSRESAAYLVRVLCREECTTPDAIRTCPCVHGGNIPYLFHSVLQPRRDQPGGSLPGRSHRRS